MLFNIKDAFVSLGEFVLREHGISEVKDLKKDSDDEQQVNPIEIILNHLNST